MDLHSVFFSHQYFAAALLDMAVHCTCTGGTCCVFATAGLFALQGIAKTGKVSISFLLKRCVVMHEKGLKIMPDDDTSSSRPLSACS